MEALAAIAILAFLTFGAIEYHVLLSKHQYAEHTMHKYKDRMRMEGFLSSNSEAQLIQDFSDFGCVVEQIDGPRESRGDSRILRTTNIETSTVSLKITCRPEPKPLIVNRLIGSDVPGDDYRIIVGGSGLSERIN